MKKPEDYMLPCLNKKIFGVDCPGCGMQRSIVHLAKGEFSEAYQMYPPVYIFVPLIIFIALNYKFNFKYGTKIIITLAIINTIVILVNYYFKMTRLYNL